MESVYTHGAANGYTDPHTFVCLRGGQRSNSVPPSFLRQSLSLDPGTRPLGWLAGQRALGPAVPSAGITSSHYHA